MSNYDETAEEGWPEEPTTSQYQEESWPEAGTTAPQEQKESWPDYSQGYDFDKIKGDSPDKEEDEVESSDETALQVKRIKDTKKGKSNKTLQIVIVVGILILFIGLIVGGVFLLGTNNGLKGDKIKRQFPAAMNVELAQTAGANKEEIRESPYFYFDTEMKSDTGLFKTPIYKGADDGAIIFVKDSQYITDIRNTQGNKSIEMICKEMAENMTRRLEAKSDEVNVLSGGKVEKHSDSEDTWTEDYRFRIESDIEITPPEEGTDGSFNVYASWYIWSEGSGSGWRMIQSHIVATFVPVQKGDGSIVVLIAHGANPKEADEVYNQATGSSIYLNLLDGESPGSSVQSRFKDYPTWSGTRLADDLEEPTKEISDGSLNRWILDDVKRTNHENRDPGTYGYFISYKHQSDYQPSGYIIGGHSTRTISGGAK